MNPVLETARFVADNSIHVALSSEGIAEFCKEYVPGESEHWLRKAPFDLSRLTDADRLHFLLAFNSINYSYWGEPKWTVSWKGGDHDGAWGMIVALGRALEDGKTLLDPPRLAELDEKELADVFQGNVAIPLFEERLQALREVGLVLCERFGGDYGNAVAEAGRDAVSLVDLTVSSFPSFRDGARFLGREVRFDKRAQLLVSDIYHVFEGKGAGGLTGIERLTAFADYKIPQVLRRLGILRYSGDLARKVNEMTGIPPGSREEVEIRAGTVMAVERIRETLQPFHPGITSAEVNDHIWLMGQDKSAVVDPYHRTRTTAY